MSSSPNKTQRNYPLVAVDANDKPVGSHNCKDAVAFLCDSPFFRVEHIAPGKISLTTRKGEYEILRHTSLNQYSTELNFVKVRITLKKMVGTITFWH